MPKATPKPTTLAALFRLLRRDERTIVAAVAAGETAFAAVLAEARS